jgi:hypothetical protein
MMAVEGIIEYTEQAMVPIGFAAGRWHVSMMFMGMVDRHSYRAGHGSHRGAMDARD